MLPIKNYIVLESQPDYSDNTRSLFDYMIKNKYNEKYHFVWLVNNPDDFKDIKIENVEFISFSNDFTSLLKRAYKVSRAKYIICCNRGISKVNSKKQISINLWHGSMIKRIDHIFANDKAMFNDFNYFSYPSEFYKKIFMNQLKLDEKQMVCLGSPRNDELFETKSIGRSMIYRENFKKMIIWLPTFRQHSSGNRVDSNSNFQLGIPVVQVYDMLVSLNDTLIANNTLLLIKLHPSQDSKVLRMKSLSNIRLISDNDLFHQGIKLYNLLGSSDALITDYSSVAYDYLLLNRPIGFTLDDLDLYRAKTGFVFNDVTEWLPGEHIYNFSQFIKFINNISNNIDDFEVQRRKINDLVNKYQDNQNCARLAEYLKL